jgi:hypothetical protein
MGERLLPATRSLFSNRQALARILVSVRRMTLDEASGWCDEWEKYAASSGLSSGAPYFWDSARGWIDAQLDVAPTVDRRPAARPGAGARGRQ